MMSLEVTQKIQKIIRLSENRVMKELVKELEEKIRNIRQKNVRSDSAKHI